MARALAAAVTAFRNGQVHLAWFGGLSGVQARRAVPGSRAIAQGIEDQDFVTYFIAHTSTGLEEQEVFPRDIADKTFTWEVVIRETAILGMLGVFTLGFFIDSAFSELRFDRALFLIAVTALLNIAVDTVSHRVRAGLRLSTALEGR